MTAACAKEQPAAAVPGPVTAAVQAAVEATCSAILGEKPVLQPPGNELPSGPCVAGIISFMGETPWSLAWVLPAETAPGVIRHAMCMDLEFESQDMGEAVAELVNILAGDVVAQMDKRRLKVQMGLPTVARGKPLELMPPRGAKLTRLDFTSKEGPFWLRVACPG